MTFEKEKREVRGTPSSTSLSIYRLCVLSSLFLVARYFSYLFRDFRVVDKGDGSFINISRNQTVNEKLKKATGLTNLDALFLSEKEIENLFQNCILPDF